MSQNKMSPEESKLMSFIDNWNFQRVSIDHEQGRITLTFETGTTVTFRAKNNNIFIEYENENLMPLGWKLS